jgi:hypothetical protein
MHLAWWSAILLYILCCLWSVLPSDTVTVESWIRIPPGTGMYIVLSALFELFCSSRELAISRCPALEAQPIICKNTLFQKYILNGIRLDGLIRKLMLRSMKMDGKFSEINGFPRIPLQNKFRFAFVTGHFNEIQYFQTPYICIRGATFACDDEIRSDILRSSRSISKLICADAERHYAGRHPGRYHTFTRDVTTIPSFP